jgi:hypothetical protein
MIKKGCFALLLLFSSCYNYGQLEFVTDLPKKLKENSGLEVVPDSDLFWLVPDGNNKDHLYGVNTHGEIIKDINIKGAKNEDWEDLASDENGNLFIGDFGNNSNSRKNLVIYRVPNPSNAADDDLKSEVIKFSYPEQKKFPPPKEKRLYDAEAFFYFEGNLYLFTKNRTKPFNGKTLLYKIPAEKGTHKAALIGEISFCTDPKKCMITAADISPDKQKVVLLSHDRIWILKDYKEDDFFSGKIIEIPLGHYSQKEAICFKTNELLYLSDEKAGPTGQNLYSLDLSKF